MDIEEQYLRALRLQNWWANRRKRAGEGAGGKGLAG
jgi:hypothetical protein